MAEQDDLDEQTQDNPLKKPVVYTIPGMEHAIVRQNIAYKTVDGIDLHMDLYYPANRPGRQSLPAVILIHGDGPVSFLEHIKDSGQYVSWGQLIAASGLIAVTFNHRSTENLTNVAGVANDIDDLISYVREHHKALHIDADTLCMWTCSAGGPFGLRAALHETPPFVRCIVSYYAFAELKGYYTALYGESDEGESRDRLAAPPTFSEGDFDEFSASELLRRRPGDVAPIFIARAGLDYPELNNTLDRFVAEAIEQNVELDFANHPTGQHGFDVRDDDERSRSIIKATLEFMKTHLLE